MNQDMERDRRSKDRAVFKPEDKIFGYFSFQDQMQQKNMARLMNISYSGVGFAIEREKKRAIEKDKTLVLHELKIVDGSQLIFPETHIHVIWVLDHDFLDYIGFGCDYKVLDEKMPGEIFSFINDAFPDRLPPP